MATRNQNAMQGSKNSSQERSTLELERQQAYIRIAVLSLILVYASIISAFYDKSIFPDVVMLVVFLLISFVSTAVIFTQKHFSPYRQFTTNFFDVVMITYLMVSMRRYGIPIFILYQWITIGCGLRFGNKPLVISAIMSMVGFLYVVADTDLWTIEPMFALGVILSLFTVPVYTSVLIKQLRFSRAQALDANDAKSRFLSRVSHDMRTPLNGIMETLNILSKSGSIRFEEQSLLRIIKESVDISLKQVNNVLDFAKIDAGKLQIESQPFNLNEVVNDTRRMASISARDKQLRILTSISPETPIRVVGDAHHLQMILMNLLSNAIKFTHRGYVAISVAPLRSVAEDQNLITIRFSVHDTGIGIDSDALDRIWESFSQESIETRNQYGGTGLGTAIAKQLTGSMGGQVGAQSKKGRGSVFWCDIPVGLIKDQDDSNDRRNAAGGRVLILSRDADYVSATKQRIAATGIGIFNVTTFEEASASVSRAARIGRPWHLVLIDENLLVDEEGQRQEKQFIEGAAAVDGWLYLLSDTPHLNADLFVVPRDISARHRDTGAMVSGQKI
jgi:two-component system sensor histidine kinase RpfC